MALLSRPRTIRLSDNRHLQCPPCCGLENYHLAPQAGREDPCFFKMLLVLSLYFCFSFVILMDKLSSKSRDSKRNSSMKGKNYQWKTAVSVFHAPQPSSRAPWGPYRHTPLDLSSPGVSRTSWILRIFNKFFIFEFFVKLSVKLYLILGFASSTTLITTVATYCWVFSWLVVDVLAASSPCACERGWCCRAWLGQRGPHAGLCRGSGNTSQ